MCKSIFKCMFEFLLILLNLPLLLVSIALIFFGVMVAFFFSTLLSWFTSLLSSLSQQEQELAQQFFAYVQQYSTVIGVVLLVLGIVMFAITIFGVCGVCYRQTCMTVIYCTLVGVISAAVIALSIVVLVDSSALVKPLMTETLSWLQKGYDDPDNPARAGSFLGIEPLAASVTVILRLLPCCGVFAYTDFQSSNNTWNRAYVYPTPWSVAQAKIPVMCCKSKVHVQGASGLQYYIPATSSTSYDSTCLSTPSSSNSYMDTSCNDYIIQHSATIGYVILGVGCGIFVIFTLAVILACMYKKKNSVHSYA